MQPISNQVNLKTGLTLMNSSDPTNALQGKLLTDKVIQKPTELIPIDELGDGIGDATGDLGSPKLGVSGGMQILGAASDIIGSFLPEKDEYSGDKGELAQSLDSAYDNVANTLMAVPGWGTIAGGAMKLGSFLGKGINALGGGTDGMCVCKGTKVFTNTGDIINIETLTINHNIIGWDFYNNCTSIQTIKVLLKPSYKNCVQITFEDGSTLKCSTDHPILSDKNKLSAKYIYGKKYDLRTWIFRKANELNEGDYVGIPNYIDYWGSNNDDNAYNIGINFDINNPRSNSYLNNIGQYNRDSVIKFLLGLLDNPMITNRDNPNITVFQVPDKEIIEILKLILHKLGIFSNIDITKYTISISNNYIDKLQTIQENTNYKESSIIKQLKIISIIHIGRQLVYNLQTNEDHTYLANGIVTHNTTTDAILGSSFFSLTPFGLINGFLGDTANTITKDDQVFNTVGASYSGSGNTIDDAVSKSGKKYGFFSKKARYKANDEINEASRQQNIMTNIANQTTKRTNIAQSMGAINNNKRSYNLSGGYDQSSVRRGKYGMDLQIMSKAKKILGEPRQLKSEGKVTPTEILLVVPEFQDGGYINKKSRTLQELIEYAKKENPRFIQRMSEPPRGIDFVDDEGKQARGSHYMEWSTDDNGNAIIYPRIQEVGKELKFFNRSDAYNRAIENKNYLIMTPEEAKLFFAEDPKYGTAYKSGWPQFFGKFQQGGSINVIPEGALHARKHNMDIDGITPKGIPVVSDENGTIEQQAEIEREEIIFRLEVTKELEQLQREYDKENTSQKEKDQLALQAGKLLVNEILYNTIDNTGLINNVN